MSLTEKSHNQSTPTTSQISTKKTISSFRNEISTRNESSDSFLGEESPTQAPNTSNEATEKIEPKHQDEPAKTKINKEIFQDTIKLKNIGFVNNQ